MRATRKTVMMEAIALLLMIGATPFVLAVTPPFPMLISGYVYIHRVDGTDVAAPEGLHIYAKMGTTQIANTTTGVNGNYTLIPEVQAAWDGEPADLWVQSVNVARITLVYMSPPVDLNLTVPLIKFNEVNTTFQGAWVVYGNSTPYGPLLYNVVVDDIVAGTDLAGVLAGTGHFDTEASTCQWTGTEWQFTWKPGVPVPVVSVGGMGANFVSWAYKDAVQPFNVTVIPGAELRLYVATDKYIMYDIPNNIYYYVNSTGTYDVMDVFGLNNNTRPYIDFGLIYTHRDMPNEKDLFIVQGLAAKGNVAACRWFAQYIDNLPTEVAELSVVVLAWNDLDGDLNPTYDEVTPITVFP